MGLIRYVTLPHELGNVKQVLWFFGVKVEFSGTECHWVPARWRLDVFWFTWIFVQCSVGDISFLDTCRAQVAGSQPCCA